MHGNGQCQGNPLQNKNTEELLTIDPREKPVSLQLFGSDPDIMSEIAKQIEERPFDILDINMGCGAESCEQWRRLCFDEKSASGRKNH